MLAAIVQTIAVLNTEDQVLLAAQVVAVAGKKRHLILDLIKAAQDFSHKAIVEETDMGPQEIHPVAVEVVPVHQENQANRL